MTAWLHSYPELSYIALLVGLFVLPRGLDRFGVPTAITSLAIGAVLGPGLGLYADDATIPFLAGLGIVSLFLFAGLEVDVPSLVARSRTLVAHVAVLGAAMVGVAFAAFHFLALDVRASLLLALAILTPSTGFILDSLPKLGLDPEEQSWVKSKAIAAEFLALGTLFVVMNSFAPLQFVGAVALLVGMILGLPWLFRLFARLVPDKTPRSDFVFLVVVALTCALITRLLGAYYLVGAFVVGIVTQRVRRELPDRFGPRVLDAVELFGAFFVTFYFFKAGLHLERADLTLRAGGIGLLLLATAVPLRVAMVVAHRGLALRETTGRSNRIAVTMLPTLVFTLVIADVLKNKFAVPDWVYGALVTYTLLNTMIPAMFFRVPAGYDQPHVAP